MANSNKIRLIGGKILQYNRLRMENSIFARSFQHSFITILRKAPDSATYHSFFHQGCCSDVKNRFFGTNYHYIAIFPKSSVWMSPKKLKEYIIDLNIAGLKLQLLDSPVSDHPATARHPKINDWAFTDDYYSVRFYPTNELDMLRYTQVLRELTLRTTSPNQNVVIFPHNGVYLPLIYFKIKKLFPKLSKYHMYWLSHAVCGNITSTYHFFNNAIQLPRHKNFPKRIRIDETLEGQHYMWISGAQLLTQKVTQLFLNSKIKEAADVILKRASEDAVTNPTVNRIFNYYLNNENENSKSTDRN